MRTRSTIAAVLAALAVAGCSAGPTSQPVATASQGTPSSGPSVAADSSAVNDTDVMFAQMLVPHHGQGIALAKLAATRADDPEVKQLAAAIAATQEPEQAAAAGWLKTWNKPPSAAAAEHAAHGGMPSTNPEVFARLSKLSGAEFDRQFLAALLGHQDDAVQIAKLETASGANGEARAFAQRVETSRTAQVALIKGIIARM